ncbi:uncharacterized protein BKA55DRAFT_567372 [Fusarium redolens]|uniref:Apple domain-containing protein n=1 Tax=Fusarium redolens TaxID=48865 RepID=A0A9P9HBM4_FUSRE|nr:uncharacterized protein BKA55DRAFT_567372 [Fusarium redolens]KAH7254315.1 hypothetical protein BKA55DRAFT_567372 [Fusarium redolens]
MVAIRSFFILSAAAGIASAGPCKPESHSSSIVSVASSTDSASHTASASATVIESTTTLADTTVETSLTESATETASSATSFITSTAETTTTEAAASTSSAAPVNNCLSETGECINTARIQCDVVLDGITLAGFSDSILQCSQFCADDDDCRGFSRRRDNGACFKALVDPDDVTQSEREGWDSGQMNTCFN